MVLGQCKLCLLEKPLCESHLAPSGLYKFCKAKELGPVRMTAEEISVANQEVTAPLLCEKCEARLNQDGENWLLPKLATMEGRFPFYDLLTRVEPDTMEGEATAYACARNPSIGFRKLTNFAIGVFWKASVHSWRPGKSGTMIDFGKYGESFRRFLLRKESFPEKAVLVIGVSTPAKAVIGFNMPFFRGVSAYHNYFFYVPGIVFVLGVGNAITPPDKQLCFFSNPLHPIVVCDLARDIFSMVGKHTRSARRSAEVEAFMGTKRPR